MKTLIALLLGAVAAASAGAPETAMTVPRMYHYIDASFGFSFWYPATWTMKEEVYDNAHSPYAGGTVIKSWVVSPPITSPAPAPALYDEQLDSIHIREFVSTKAEPSANIVGKTMGGLNEFAAPAPNAHGYTMVPLSAKYLVIVEYNNGDISNIQIHLANTIVATDPAAGAPVSRDEQMRTVRAERVLYGAVGKRLGNFYLDDEYVYGIRGETISRTNPLDFHLASTFFPDGTKANSDFYATDGIRVYCALAFDPADEVLKDADPHTFAEIAHRDGEGFCKDQSHVWYGSKLVPGADPDTFAMSDGIRVHNPDGTDTFAHDGRHTYSLDNKYNIVVEK